jgi:hypothetical protein
LPDCCWQLLANAAALEDAAARGDADAIHDLVSRQGELIAAIDSAGASSSLTAGQLRAVLDACGEAERCLAAGRQEIARELASSRDWREGLAAYASHGRRSDALAQW